MSTDLLDQLIQQRRDRQERERQAIVKKSQQWLDQYGSEYGIQKACVFGSATRPGHFHEKSDVDIALSKLILPNIFWRLAYFQPG